MGKMINSQFLMKSNPDGGYTYTTGDQDQNLQYSFKLDEPFVEIGYDGKKHNVI
ncbi:hypothetical protein DICVIV_14364 [Dictyocaulus viviparus]|uniref:Uncharacterized protein n=1 Tax=Dictyocaulus viviparus TaxID=29172 RepID=A0A0D8X5J8_DICVI|nr:hypothetical protein DICVIV_14364 [Dictyocaulus viviparus]